MKNVKSFSLVSAVVLVLVLGAQAQTPVPQPPLLEQIDVQAIVDFCMNPTGDKLMQPAEPGTDRALFCAGVPFVALYMAAAVRNTQALDQLIVNQVKIMADIAQIQADLGAIQTQLISNTARITTLEAAPLNLQGQIDALVANVARVKAALQ